MANTTITLKSGHKLELQLPSFKVGTGLYKVIAAELLLVDVSFKMSDLKGIMNRDIGELKNVFLRLLSSDKLEEAVFAAAAGCTYDDTRIDRKTFEPAEARGDWLPAALEVMKYTLIPFFENLDLGSPAPSPGPAAGQQ
jgi:hypothetical protein